MAVYLGHHVLSTPLGGTTPFSMWQGRTSSQLEHLRIFGARAFLHEERYVKNLRIKAWEGRMVGYGNDSKR